MITTPSFWIAILAGATIYWLLPRWRELFLITLFGGFIAFLDWKSAIWLLGFSSFAFYATQIHKGRHLAVKVLAAASVGAYLAYYKYIPPVTRALSGEKGDPGGLLLPIGVSYFTFKIIHYVIECHRKNIGAHTFSSFLAYMFFLPMFAAGPIERFDEFLKNRKTEFSWDLVHRGGTRILYGLIKKFVICDLLLARTERHNLNNLQDAIPIWSPALKIDRLLHNLDVLNPLFVWQFVINNYVSWYFDFSGYTDIAIGLGLLFGVKLCENFNFPFLATNIGEFWKRYHMSLSNWAQRYVYFPVLGTTRNAHVALFATMIMIGLWHAGNVNYVAWGSCQATLLSAHLLWTRYKRRRLGNEEEEGTSLFGKVVESRPFAVAGWAVTFLTVSASAAFILTQKQGVWTGLRVFAALFGVQVD